MKELDNCLQAKRKIDEINDKIEKLRTVILSPKNQVMTGMPRGSSTDNVLDRYIIKVEELEERKEQIYAYQHEQWQIIQDRASELKLTEEKVKLLYLRFVKGYSWKKCCEILKKEYGNWNINKVFRIYRHLGSIL